MAGLLDFLSTPQGQGLLSGVASYAMNARRGQPINNIGRGLAGGITGYVNANDQIRQNEEKDYLRQYRQMQIDEITRKRADQDAYRAQFKPAGTQAFKPDDPFNEGAATFGENNLKTVTPPMFAGQAIDPKLAAIAPFLDPKEMFTAISPDTASTAEIKNYKFAQGLPEDQRALFMAKSGTTPSTVQEWEYFNKLDPQAQGRFLEMKRNPQIINLGGSQAVRAPGGGIAEQYAVTPKITETPDYQAAQETAKVTARETVQRGAEANSNLPKVQASAENARNMIRGVLEHPGFSSTVGVTALPGARFVPGTKEADFMSRMDQLKGSAFLQAFETLKGGGQITEVEGKKATDAINRMSISTSENEFRQAAQDFLSVVDRAEENAKRAAPGGKPATSARRTLDRGEILNVELQEALGRGDTQNAELVRQEMRRMGVKEAGARKQASGTFKDPISVTNEADYNSVPKGKYYRAPDGSIRVRK